jgi:hypothetical protein
VTFVKYLNIIKDKTIDKVIIKEIKKGKRNKKEDK